jgi:two-component sensor histidine kinase
VVLCSNVSVRSVSDEEKPRQVEQILETPGLADALESDRFKQFLDHVPIAIAVSQNGPKERVIYVNLEFERVSGLSAANVVNRSWSTLDASAEGGSGRDALSDAIAKQQEYLGSFRFEESANVVDAWSNVIEDDDGAPAFRLVAMAAVQSEVAADRVRTAHALQEKDTLLLELQHRVKNNLQMITALIRLEARQVPQEGERFDRLAGRVEALSLLYESLSAQEDVQEVDLGIYLSQVAAAVMRAHGVEGIRLDLKVDTWPVSINVAMPTGLVVNELLTNALKHGFKGRDGGTIKLHGLVDSTGCIVTIADDGVGLAAGTEWPQSGKLSALIVKSLTQNAGARVEVHSVPGEGVRVTIGFSRRAASKA